ncbi:MAG: hypothetical protein ACLQSR_08955 [Limisphaerales bacterium]
MNSDFEPRGKLEWHKRYDNIDGTGEMFMGLMFLAFALLNYLQTLLPKDSIWNRNFFCRIFCTYAVLALVLAPGFWLRNVIKKRITFPRTGYVAGHSHWRQMFAPEPPGAEAAPGVPTRWAMCLTMLAIVLVGAIVGGAFVCLLVFEKRHLNSMMWLANARCVVYPTILLAVYAFFIWQMGREHRWKWLMLLLMAVGFLVIGLLGPGDIMDAARPVMLFVGVMWIISGLGTLFLYLRRTHPPVAEAQ